MPRPIEVFLEAIESHNGQPAKQLADGSYVAFCPVHGDGTKKADGRSFSFCESSVGNVLFKCQYSPECNKDDILHELGLGWPDTFANSSQYTKSGSAPEKAEPPPSRPKPPPREKPKMGRIVKVYDYVDLFGKVRHQTVRFADPKDFRQRQPDPSKKDGYAWHLNGIDTILYHYQRVKKAVDQGGAVFLMEGEKDADRMYDLGWLGDSGNFAATTMPMGAGAWRKSYSEMLRGAWVIIVPDFDILKKGVRPGVVHAVSVATALQGIARKVTIVNLPDYHEDMDFSDWVDATKPTQADFQAAVNDSGVFHPKKSIPAIEERYGFSLSKNGPKPAVAEKKQPKPAKPAKPRPKPSAASVNGLPKTDDQGRALIWAPQPGRRIRDFLIDLADVMAPKQVWFRRGNTVQAVRTVPVRGAKNDMELPGLAPVRSEAACSEAERYASFFNVKTVKDGVVTTPVSPGVDTWKKVLAGPDFIERMPMIESIIHSPVPYFHKETGALEFSKPGYDPDSWTYMNPSGAMNLEFIHPTDALDELMNVLLAEFCWESEDDKVMMLAMLLTPAVKALTGELSPFFILDANRQGAGKSLLANIYSLINNGTPAPISSYPGDSDEMRKRITSWLAAGMQLAVIDNLKVRLNSDALEALATSKVWEDRKLGVNENQTLVNTLVMIITTNDSRVSPDMARRAAFIRLEFFEESLADRKFRIDKLEDHVKEHREHYYSCLMSLVKSWADNGAEIDKDVSFSSFDAWAQMMAGILKNAGIEGFLRRRDERAMVADTESLEMTELVKGWLSKFGVIDVGTTDLYHLADELGLFDWIFAKGNESGQKKSFGKFLARFKNRVFGGLKIVQTVERKPVRYRLVQNEETVT